MTHEISYTSEGRGLDMVTTPNCSCGWSGEGVAEHNDDHPTLIATQVQKHLRSTEVPPFRFANVWCSQCGKEFGPGNSGFSHCANHK